VLLSLARMNHTLSYAVTNHSNSFEQCRSPLASDRFVELSKMNRDRTSPEMDDVSTGKSDKDKTMVPLHDDFTPGDNDVICGRGKK